MSINKTTCTIDIISNVLVLATDHFDTIVAHRVHCKSVVVFACSLILLPSFRMTDVWVYIARSICNFLNRLTTTENVRLLTLFLETIFNAALFVSFLQFSKLHRNTTTTTEKQITTDRLIMRSVFRACISCHSINSRRCFTNLKVISFLAVILLATQCSLFSSHSIQNVNLLSLYDYNVFC